jgi:hypothetical protein
MSMIAKYKLHELAKDLTFLTRTLLSFWRKILRGTEKL